MKHICYLLVLLLILTHISCSEEMLEKYHKYHKSHKSHNHKPKSRPLNLDIPDTRTYFQGWVKYYHYGNDTHYRKPPSLFQNSEFDSQRIPKNKLSQKDGFGSLHIPNKASFFMVLYANSLSLYGQRYNQVNHMIDSLKIAHIRVIPEDDVFNGGIRDDNSFKFGYCIEIIADIPTHYTVKKKSGQGNAETWIVCTSTSKAKQELMTLLIKLKVKHQRKENQGLKVTKADTNTIKKVKPGLGSMMANPLGKKGQEAGKPVNGYWVLLQDWTGCSKKCAGGLSYKQRMCVPPKAGGKPCKGHHLLVKPCNTHPCPSVNSLLSLIAKSKKSTDPATSPKPIVKAGVFSNRPQRYSKCIIKENDAFIMIKVKGTPNPIRKPIRIMMNLMTISIYNDDTYQEQNYSYDLQKTRFTTSHTHCCFDLQDNWNKATICGYTQYCGKKGTNSWVNGWSNDIKLFKTDCNGKPTTLEKSSINNILASADIEDEITKKSSEIMEEAQLNAAAAQSIAVKKTVIDQAKRQYERKKKKAQNLTFTVIGREINLENLVKKEEQRKEEIETIKLQEKIRQEEYKSECLEKAFNERELDDEFVETENESLRDISEIHSEARKKIEESRLKLKKSIQQIKLKAKTKRQGLSQKLKQIRSKMSKEIMLANKNGSIDTCRRGRKDMDYRENYCNKSFVDDWTRNSDCKSDDYCYICCENEFGAMYVTQRDNCYKMCDYKPKKKKVTAPHNSTPKSMRANISSEKPKDKAHKPTGTGRWVWAPKEKTKNHH